MKFRHSLSTFVVCLSFVMQGFALLSGQNSDYATPPPKPRATQPQRDIPRRLPSRTENKPTTHGHPVDKNPGRNPRDSGHGAEIAGIASGAVATAVIIDLIHQHESASKLKANRPQLPKAFDMNNLHIIGFVRDDWPIAVEYALPGNVEAECGIAVGDKKGAFALPTTNGERRIVLSRVPGGFSEKPHSGDYWLHLDASPMPVSSSGWPGLRIYAVAAGPRAVGSVAIDQVSFAPTDKPVHLGSGEVALFGFHAHSDFDSVAAEFQLVVPHQGRNFLTTDDSMNINPVSEDERVQGLRWEPKNVKSGDHIVRIVAWSGIDKGADWASAFSADMVSIEK